MVYEEENKSLVKIIATIGPSSAEERILSKMIKYVDVFRFNFSHGSHEYHKKNLKLLRKIKKDIPILLDTKGPEIRTGPFKEETLFMEGDLVKIFEKEILGDKESFSIPIKGFVEKLKKYDKILIDDGLIEFEVIEVNKEENFILARAMNTAYLNSNKSVNIPGINLDLDFLNDKDKEDIKFGKENDFDFLALSFVRSKKDIEEVKKFLKEINANNFKIIAKIENKEAINNIEEIIDNVDGVMIARGDLGVEIDLEEVPIWQKKIIKLAREKGKFSIVATQMLESMRKNPRPTRAEISDVLNAVLDGTDAVMLSGETASGKYPLESTKTMRRIVKKAEEMIKIKDSQMENDELDIITKNAALATHRLNIKSIVVATRSGLTAEKVSKYRPKKKIIAFTSQDKVKKQLSLRFGIFPYILDVEKNLDERIKSIIKKLIEDLHFSKNDKIIFLAGTKRKKSNLLIIDEIKEFY